jgi:hypothetical protein
MKPLPRDTEYATYSEQCAMRNGQYKPTWGPNKEERWPLMARAEAWEQHMLKTGCQLQLHYEDEENKVLLGKRSIADTQKKEDDEAGGLVFLALNRR